MNSPILILVAVASLLLVKAETDSGIHNLINLGQVDGKNYFYERDVLERNWTTAGNYCKESGMELATIETPAQAEFLKSKHVAGKFHLNHWTAGRDAHLPREFTWNTTGTMPAVIDGVNWNFLNLEYQTCVAYFAHSRPELYPYPCSFKLWGVLCQT